MIVARQGMIKAKRIKAAHLEMTAVGQGTNVVKEAILGMIWISDISMTQNPWLRQLRKANATLTHELNEYKYAIKESNDIRDRCRSTFHLQEIELEKYKVYKNCQLEKEVMEPIQADCDVKATNIILQGLPPEVYALVSNHRIAKELWEIIQLLMQGTSLTK
ncbi:hypothetical protein Tco_0321424 [Tanacetum coccineum]